MTAQEIIEKIRAEVNRLQHTDIPHTDEWWDGADYVRRRMKDVLSALEKEEKPMNQEGLEEEITEFIANHYEVDYYDGLQHHGEYLDTYDVEDIARHFYALGQQSKEQPVCDGLEDAAKQHRAVSSYGGDINLAMENSFKAGWLACREQMMKEAVEGEVYLYHSYNRNATAIVVDIPKENLGDKVRIIIVKED